MFCSNCGAQLKEGDAFCGNCGTPVRRKQESSNGKRWIIIAGAVVVVGLAVMLILLLGGKSGLTMDEFIDKYIEAYKSYGSYDYYVNVGDEAFRQEVHENVDKLSGENTESSYFGAVECLYCRIKRHGDPNIRIYFLSYPDKAIAKDAFAQFRTELDQDIGIEGTVKGDTLVYALGYENQNYLKIVRAGKTILVMECDEEVIVDTLFDFFEY